VQKQTGNGINGLILGAGGLMVFCQSHQKPSMLPFYSFNFVLLVVFAVFFYRAGVFDDGPALLWAVLSILISFLFWQWLQWGLMGMILGQIGLFVGIGVVRVVRKQ
jgi:hypothetical protein